MILKKQGLDYDGDCKCKFGTCVQAHQDPKQLQKKMPIKQTINTICPRPDENIQEGHLILNLNTGRAINARKMTELPVTNLAIKTAEAMAEQDGIKGSKFKNKQGIPIHPNDWIAGVDHNDPQHCNNWIKNQPTQDQEQEDEDKTKPNKTKC